MKAEKILLFFSMEENYFSFIVHKEGVWETWIDTSLYGRDLHGPGPAQGPYPVQPAGPGRHMRGDFFQWAGPAKRGMSFLTAESGYKKKKTNNLTCQSGLTKQRLSF